MILVLLQFIFMFNTDPVFIFDFNKECDMTKWYVVNDGVMGGKSKGKFELNPAGHGVFSGFISLDNNGGFSSIRHNFDAVNVSAFKRIAIRLKGDGKKYQLRIKSKSSDYYSYVQYFDTSGEWQTVEILLKDFYPTFRGMTLNMPNFPGEVMAELGFLFGQKKVENFKLEIDGITLK